MDRRDFLKGAAGLLASVGSVLGVRKVAEATDLLALTDPDITASEILASDRRLKLAEIELDEAYRAANPPLVVGGGGEPYYLPTRDDPKALRVMRGGEQVDVLWHESIALKGRDRTVSTRFVQQYHANMKDLIGQRGGRLMAEKIDGEILAAFNHAAGLVETTLGYRKR